MDPLGLLVFGLAVLAVIGGLLAALFKGNPTSTYSAWFSGFFSDPSRLPWPTGVQEDVEAPAWDVEAPTWEDLEEASAPRPGPEGTVEDLGEASQAESEAGSFEEAGEPQDESANRSPGGPTRPMPRAALHSVVRPWDRDE